MKYIINEKGFLTVPVAILVAGVLIAAAIIFAVGKNSVPNQVVEDEEVSGDIDKLRPVDDKDHVLGSIEAPVKVVEFSDTECPFCKRFHETMSQVMKEYTGKVAWVYRHFPLDAIHSKARKESEATECAAELGGNEKFWAYTNRLFEVTPSNDGLDLAELPKIAEYVGVDVDKFKKCLDSGRYAEDVEEDYQDGVIAGVRGTPHSVVITKSGKKIVINGAQPFENVKKIIDLALEE